MHKALAMHKAACVHSDRFAYSLEDPNASRFAHQARAAQGTC